MGLAKSGYREIKLRMLFKQVLHRECHRFRLVLETSSVCTVVRIITKWAKLKTQAKLGRLEIL